MFPFKRMTLFDENDRFLYLYFSSFNQLNENNSFFYLYFSSFSFFIIIIIIHFVDFQISYPCSGLWIIICVLPLR